MKKLLFLAVVSLLVAADVGTRLAVQAELSDRVAAAVDTGGETTARVRSFPFLGRLLVSGRVSSVRVAVADVRVGRLTFATVGVELRGVRLDRRRLLEDRTVELREVRRGTAFALVSDNELQRILGVPVTISDGSATVTVAGRRVDATLTVTEGVLRARVAGVTLPSVTIPQAPLLPCVTDAELLAGQVRLSCTIDEIPPELLERVQAQV